MRIASPSRYYLWIIPVALLALVGLVWNRPQPVSAAPLVVGGIKGVTGYDLDDFKGRFISAETFYDTSSVHDAGAGNIGPAIDVASAAVLVSNGKGFVCGEVDGYYTLGTAGKIPGINTGPQLVHGTYTVDPAGRVDITTCLDAIQPTAGSICQDNSACPAAAFNGSTRDQVGYLQGEDATELDTVSQVNGDSTTGFTAHTRRWTKVESAEEKEHHRHHDDDDDE